MSLADITDSTTSHALIEKLHGFSDWSVYNIKTCYIACNGLTSYGFSDWQAFKGSLYPKKQAETKLVCVFVQFSLYARQSE